MGAVADPPAFQAPEELFSLRFPSADLMGLYFKADALLENDTARHTGLPRPRIPLPAQRPSRARPGSDGRAAAAPAR